MESIPFSVFLKGHKEGLLDDELGETLRALTAAVINQNKQGNLTLKITISPNKDGKTVFVTEAVKLSEPESPRSSSLMFVDVDRGCVLTRHDPNQRRFDFPSEPLLEKENENHG